MATTNLDDKRVSEVVSHRIAPLLQVDRGTVEVVKIFKRSGKIQVRLAGAYLGSPCRDTVVKHVIEPILKNEFREISLVELVD